MGNTSYSIPLAPKVGHEQTSVPRWPSKSQLQDTVVTVGNRCSLSFRASVGGLEMWICSSLSSYHSEESAGQ